MGIHGRDYIALDRCWGSISCRLDGAQHWLGEAEVFKISQIVSSILLQRFTQGMKEGRHVGWEVCVDQLPLCFLPKLAIQGSNLRINDEN
jgi:hypothetical protein